MMMSKKQGGLSKPPAAASFAGEVQDSLLLLALDVHRCLGVLAVSALHSLADELEDDSLRGKQASGHHYLNLQDGAPPTVLSPARSMTTRSCSCTMLIEKVGDLDLAGFHGSRHVCLLILVNLRVRAELLTEVRDEVCISRQSCQLSHIPPPLHRSSLRPPSRSPQKAHT